MFPRRYWAPRYFAPRYFPPVVTIVTRKAGAGLETHTYYNPSDADLAQIRARLIQEDNEIIAIIVAAVSGGAFPWEA